MNLQQSTATSVPVTLVSAATGAPLTGVAASDVIAYIVKPTGVTIKDPIGNWAELHSTYAPGEYALSLDAIDTDTVGFIEYFVSTATSQVYRGLMTVWVNTLDTLGGLLHQNAVVRDQTYTTSGRLESAMLYVYDSKLNAQLNDGATGLVGLYAIDCEYDIESKQTLYRLVREDLPS